MFSLQNHGSCGVLHHGVTSVYLSFKTLLSKCGRDYHIYYKRANSFYTIVKFSQLQKTLVKMQQGQ